MNMVKENKDNSSHHANKNKSRLSLNVGGADGFGGMVLLGGGLAVAGLMAAFTIIKNRNGRKKYDDSVTPSNKKQDATQGLSFFLQTPSSTVHQNSCFKSHETSKIRATVCHIDSSEIVSSHSLPLEDEPVPLMDGEKENSGKCRQEISSDDSNFSTEKSSLPVLDGASLAQPENKIRDESGENVHLTETIQIKKMEEAIESETLAVENISPMQSVEEEEEEEYADDGDNSEEDIIEDEEENPEGEFSTGENPSIQSVEDDDDDGEGSEENVIEKEKESSEGQFSVEDEVNKEDESVTTGKLAVEEKSPTPSFEEEEQEREEDDNDGNEEHDIEKGEEISEGKLSLEQIPPNPLMQSIEKENDNEDENNDVDSIEEHVIEKEEESSEGTVCSSIESNVEAIWPAEIIEALSQEIKEMNASNQYSGEKIASKTEKYDFLVGKRDRNIINEESSNGNTKNLTATFHKKAPQETLIMNDQTEHDLKQRIWVSSILVLLFVLVFLHIHRTTVPGDLCHDPVIFP